MGQVREVQRQPTSPKQPPEQQPLPPPSTGVPAPMDSDLQLAGNQRQWHYAALQQSPGRLAQDCYATVASISSSIRSWVMLGQSFVG